MGFNSLPEADMPIDAGIAAAVAILHGNGVETFGGLFPRAGMSSPYLLTPCRLWVESRN